MGNRAIITTRENFENNGIGVYVHWNGGYDSVQAFLKYCELKGYRSPETDSYGWARLCQVIGNFFGGTLSVGIDNFDKDAGEYQDNGTYIIKDWKIVGRECYNYEEQINYDLDGMLLAIDLSMPETERLGDFLTAKEIPVSDLMIGDEVYMLTVLDKYKKFVVIGFGDESMVNGRTFNGVPYVNMYGDDEKGYSWNVNNYITTKTVRVCR